MKAKELQEYSEKEREAKLRELRAGLFNLRVQAKTGRLEKPGQIRLMKKDIARLLTVENQKKKAGAVKEGAHDKRAK
ncbi:MAG TPA: 50S ribosomal protein L29 [bacterium]|nr:50S ribosomal protein L29 [bacterium]